MQRGTVVRQIQRLRMLIPPWQMPSDPVKAVWWFLRWSLTVLVHFFWLPILGMIVFEAVSNGRVSGPFSALWSGLVTLVVGLIVWGVLYFLLTTIRIATRISGVMSDLGEFQRTFASQRPPDAFSRQRSDDAKIIESTIEIKEEKRSSQ